MVTFFDLGDNTEPTIAMMIMLYFELFVIVIVIVAAISLLFAFRREYPKKLAFGFDYTQHATERSDWIPRLC
uniref:NADH dehydrogenase subunit 3 n=1 Tax=Ditylenchus dipsaci TaxID=166011 RepID=A0A915E5S1_9BILA